ncbi:MAG: carbamoyl phosphate synthase small subunit [Defluviitaleaceae bacterium]|nr:carbamoyl phosphate synthase small subunit [Defluviitaleaceae bacterium]
MSKAYLILENGASFEGEFFGAEGNITGEVVFATSMTGYLETLTDPSYYGQIVVQTFPLIGNYGVIPSDFESDQIKVSAYIVNYNCQAPSNFRTEGSLGNFFKRKNIVAISGIDTRQLTKIIRDNGVMNGKITTTPPTDQDKEEAKAYTIKNALEKVSYNEKVIYGRGNKRRVALLDYGAKKSIAKNLTERNCEVHSFPYNATIKEIMEINPEGIMLSNGPGDPNSPENSEVINTIKQLQETNTPIFGICLGHQLLALANGYKTEKLKFGHRGSNQPVQDLSTGRVYISSQNHGYAVVCDKSSFVNVNDKTCEGIEYENAFSVQFHPEANGGPYDTTFLFDKFIKMMDLKNSQKAS